jgi:hypothetical protein
VRRFLPQRELYFLAQKIKKRKPEPGLAKKPPGRSRAVVISNRQKEG